MMTALVGEKSPRPQVAGEGGGGGGGGDITKIAVSTELKGCVT